MKNNQKLNLSPYSKKNLKQNHFDSFPPNQITHFINNYITHTSQSISMHQLLFKNNFDPRCLKHNDVVTLYCEKDKEPLCVSCMYHGTQHKNHKVIPLKNASKSVQIDTLNFRNKLTRKIQKIEETIKIGTQNILKIEKIYPNIKERIEINFNEIRKLLMQKQQQQLIQLYEITQKLRMSHMSIIQESNKLLNYCIQKSRFDHLVIQDQKKLYVRNILEILAQSLNQFEITVKPINYLDYPQISTKIFQEIQKYIAQNLTTKSFPKVIYFNKENHSELIQLKQEVAKPKQQLNKSKPRKSILKSDMNKSVDLVQKQQQKNSKRNTTPRIQRKKI